MLFVSDAVSSLSNNILRKAASYRPVDKNKNKKEYKNKIPTNQFKIEIFSGKI